ncbi:MAG TPA: AI-2E family transporter, partial [Thermoleophilaceae bacterium]
GWVRLRRDAESPAGDEAAVIEIEAGALSGLFAAPKWLRDLGLTAWLLFGVVAALTGAVVLLGLTKTIVLPVITAAIIASVMSPAVGWLEGRGVPRALGAVLVFLVLILIGVAVFLGVVGGITSQSGKIGAHLHSATAKMQGWLEDLGVSDRTAAKANQDATGSASAGVKALLQGVRFGIQSLASLVVFLSFTLLSLFFLLKDAPTIRGWAQRHMGVPIPVAQVITGRTTTALRGYFAGCTIVSAFTAVIVGIGALVLGVPLVGTIMVVTFLAGYVPYLGAWTAGIFAVLIALGSQGTGAAVALALITLLGNGILQQMVQPVAFGATLGLHPLAVLIVTIAGGSLFGTVGLILAAPLTSAVVQISSALAGARAEREEPLPAPGEPAEGSV